MNDWLGCVVGAATARPAAPLIGALPGDGVGPEVVDAALLTLRRLEEAGAPHVGVEVGGNDDRFCAAIFDRGGAILIGPGAGRDVHDLRRRLDLFLNITPVQARTSLPDASPLKPDALAGLDLLVVRENAGGIRGEADVRRFLDAAARLAAHRRGNLAVVLEASGVTAGDLWRDCGTAAAGAHGVSATFVDVDLMAYRLVAAPRDFDVVAAPDLCGDALGGLAGVLIGGRALTFSGNFSPRGDALYQTNHGAAHETAGTDRANPAGLLLSLAMLLRVSLGLAREAGAIESALRRVWRDGVRTLDVAERGSRLVGTREMAEIVSALAASNFAGAGETDRRMRG